MRLKCSCALENEGDVSGLTGAQLENLSDSRGGTQFLRPEDGSWDPNNPSDYYFVTTDRYDQVKDGVGATVGRSRLYRLHFTDITQPELGGTIEAVLDGTEAGNMFDNITVDTHGRVLLQEDVGGQAHNGKLWMYEIATDRLVLLAQHDPVRFGDLVDADNNQATPPVITPPTAPFNNDEESSGIIDVSSILGPGKYLLDIQAHYGIGGELVEGGQLVMMEVPVAPTVAAVQVNDGSDQRSMVNSVMVTLNGTVTAADIAAGAFSLTRDEDGAVINLLVQSVTNAGGQTQVVLTFSGSDIIGGSLADGHYTLTIDGSKIHDGLGQAADADGDGFAGGGRSDSFHRLFGDVNGDDQVDATEVAFSAHHMGARLGDADYLWYLDYEANGLISGRDQSQVAGRQN